MWIWAPSRADAASCNACHRHKHGLLSQWRDLDARKNSQDLDIPPAFCVQALHSKAMRCKMCESWSLREHSGERVLSTPGRHTIGRDCPGCKISLVGEASELGEVMQTLSMTASTP